VFGSLPHTSANTTGRDRQTHGGRTQDNQQQHEQRTHGMFAASCGKQQAGSLLSPALSATASPDR